MSVQALRFFSEISTYYLLRMVALLTVLTVGCVATHNGVGAPHDPPQDESIATGDKQVLIARVDFPDATSSGTAS